MASTGKVFADSSSIYQDEAKVLFNYYQQAAERIVNEEERIEKQILDLESQVSTLEEKKSKLWPWILLFVFPYFIKKNQLLKQIAELRNRIDEFHKMHDEIFRNYKITKLGVAYVPVAEQIQYEDKSFIVDYTGQVANSTVTLQLSRQNELLGQAIAKLDSLGSDAPIVETSNEAEPVDTSDYSLSMQQVNQNDFLGQIDRALRTISYCMNDLDITSVELPLVQDHSQHLDKLNEYATTDIPAGAPVVTVFNKDVYQQDIQKFQELNNLKNSLSTETEQFEDVLKNLMRTMASTVQSLSALKLSSSDKVVRDSNRLLYRILKAPYNHYSPMLEAEEIQRIREEKFDYTDSVQGYTPFSLRQSSRVRYNIITDEWMAEDGSKTTMPFGIHQIYEEIVAPVVQNLMQENRIKRLEVYNHIKDQKISYLNKWHQDTDSFYRDNRKQSADIINLMQESLREYVAAYNTLITYKKTQDSMESSNDLSSSKVENEQNTDEAILAFEAQAKMFETVQNDFEEYIDRLKEDIDNRAEEFGHIEYYDARLQDGHSNEVAVASNEIMQLDPRRKDLAAANPLLAKKSEIPPAPHVEACTYDDLALNLTAIANASLDAIANHDTVPEKDAVTNNASDDVYDTNEEEIIIVDAQKGDYESENTEDECGEDHRLRFKCPDCGALLDGNADCPECGCPNEDLIDLDLEDDNQ